MAINFSEKQREVWRNTINEHHRWNISEGATRSGKTYLDYWKIPWRIRHAGQEGLILLLGNTKGTLERNVLDPLRNMWGADMVGRIGSNNKIRLFDRNCYALGADNVGQVDKLRGSGLAYGYGDEVPTWHEEVFTMLKSRLDKPGACFDATCNPDNPNHWFKKFLDSDADIYKMHFHIDDNPFEDPVFVAELKKEYAGTVYYQRLIEGLWVAAEGIIYRLFADKPKAFILDIEPQIMYSTIGLDFPGNAGKFAINCTGFESGLRRIITLEEHYDDKTERLTPGAVEEALVTFVKQQITAGRKVVEIRADSAEPVMIRGCKNALMSAGLGIPVKNAIKGEVNDRIRLYTMLMGADRYGIMKNCVHTIDAFQSALWNPKKTAIGIDERLDDGTTNIDSLDAQEYSTEPYARQLIDMGLLYRRSEVANG